MQKIVPSYNGTLRSHQVEVPACIAECSGIRIFGRRIKSLVFSTDVAIIKNVNADAIIAVYPFTPQPAITQAIINVSDVPVFVGVGGGMTNGDRSVRLAQDAENQGAYGVVVNAPITTETISKMKAVFTPDGVTTAANASGINDAAAAAIIMSVEKAKELLAQFQDSGLVEALPDSSPVEGAPSPQESYETLCRILG